MMTVRMVSCRGLIVAHDVDCILGRSSQDVTLHGRRHPINHRVMISTRAGHVVVHGRDLVSVRSRRLDHKVYLVLGQHEAAHDHDLVPVTHEGEPGAERRRGLQLHAVQSDRQIGARQPNAVDAALASFRSVKAASKRHARRALWSTSASRPPQMCAPVVRTSLSRCTKPK